ncbi:hypothetical protein HGRIS_007686 [Hohenbuehelia grisea]|uniref:Uncharacterized protein n=1 Tax=Hohenbuehelia grisea TaxID=104357 RepID=A0ABR3J5L0_9AGAR
MAKLSPRRLLLVQALNHAQEAVTLDKSKQPRAAILEYRRCINLLSEVLQSASLGEGRRTKDSLPKVKELHVVYTKRIQRLIGKYKIPPLPVEMPSAAK